MNNWTKDHTWGGLILIKNETGDTIATLEKHASGTPGSGIPVDTHAKLQGKRADLIVAAPVMLAALKAVEMWSRGYGTKTEADIIRDYVTPAIAAAEGRSHA